MDAHLLLRALEQHDQHGVLVQMSHAIEAMQKELRDPLQAILTDVRNRAGRATAKQLKAKLRAASMRAAVDEVDFEFDVTNARAVEWARKHAAELLDDLADTTREQIRDLVEDAFTEQFKVDDLANEINAIIGDKTRANLIAQTETMRASNAGQLEAWSQAREQGLLLGNERIEWITTPDDKLCPVCEPLDGQTVAPGEKFNVDGDMIDGPPAHPRCRCATGLSF